MQPVLIKVMVWLALTMRRAVPAPTSLAIGPFFAPAGDAALETAAANYFLLTTSHVRPGAGMVTVASTE